MQNYKIIPIYGVHGKLFLKKIREETPFLPDSLDFFSIFLY